MSPGRKPEFNTRTIIHQDAPVEGYSTIDQLSNHSHTTLQHSDVTNDTQNEDKRIFYFAYGSNLSPTQMRLRCEYDPSQSARPLAIARIDRWRWLICERGYANVIPPVEWRVGRQASHGDIVPLFSSSSAGMEAKKEKERGEDDVVFGVLYEMTAEDELLLDGYEGVDYSAPPSQYDAIIDTRIRPREQEDGSYNKWYVPARVTKWLHRDSHDAAEEEKQKDDVTVLLYVDEKRLTPAAPKFEYIARMNRAIAESVELGMPKTWVESVIRPAIPDS